LKIENKLQEKTEIISEEAVKISDKLWVYDISIWFKYYVCHLQINYQWLLPVIDVLQIGHTPFIYSHWSTHFEWNLWKHYKTLSSSPGAKSTMQITQLLF